MFPTYRQYLQKVASAHTDRITRQQAQALLNVVGDDGKLDANFINQDRSMVGKNGITLGSSTSYGARFGQAKGAPTEGLLSNGYSAYDLNRGINSNFQNLYKDELSAINEGRSGWWEKPASHYGGGKAPHYGGSGASSAISERQRIQAMREAEAKRKEQENNARNLAYINEQLRYMPGELDRINRAEQNKLALINNNYNDALGYSNRAWDRARQDYESDVSDRLRTRSERVGMADDDFKKQNDAYSRYFARIGAGNSSVAQYTAPTLLARAASKIRNEIERDNAEQDRLQTLNFNRAKEDHDYNLFSLGRQKALQEAETKSLFDNKRSGYFNELSKLEGQRSAYQGRDYNSIIADARGARDKAVGYANSAVNAGKITPDMTYKPVSYSNVADSDWKYKGTESKIETDTPEEYNDLYNKYFRDEEEKKKKRWGMGISGGV